MRKGDITLIPFPFTDLSSHKTRPALVLGSHHDDIVVAFITSKVIKQEQYDYDISPDSRNGLKVESLIRLSKIATIDRELALGILGTVNEDDIHAINKKLIAFLALKN